MSFEKIKKNETVEPRFEEISPLLSLKKDPISYQRWIMLFVFSLNSMVSGILFIGISPKSVISKNYYKTSEINIQLLNNIFPVMYTVTAMPSSYFVFKTGLRPVLVVASAMNVLGTAFQLTSSRKNGFILLVIGQLLAAIGNSAILQMPSRLSSQWFQSKERGKATAIGYFMSMIGASLSYLQNTLMITEYNNLDKLNKQYQVFYLYRFVFVIITFLLTLVCFKNSATPPSMFQSHSQLSQNLSKKETFKKYISMLLKDKYFLAMSQSYSIYYGLTGAISLFLNLFMDKYKNDFAEKVGWMGVFNLICGIVGCFVFGILLDKLKKFRALATIINFSAMMTWLAFILTLKKTNSFYGPFALFLIFGFFSYPYVTVGFEQSAEMTFPVPEEFSSAFILIISHIYGLIFGLVFGYLYRTGLVETVPYIVTGFYFLSTLLTCSVKTDLKRYSSEFVHKFNSILID
ncbi:heme transporter FLVCR1 isoform X1 [Hydra vulgaris]|uniref:heme transporter FLVCR1 isoform X1 n=1 Tax=Hydra vulgaris TaxID=6087 RepID=UPI001F5F741E|nr:feline leukemia virus subgroup C receptor-related protein 1 [Hydra vulgaris]